MELWQQHVDLLCDRLPSQQFNTWIRPLQVEAEGDELRVYVPNRSTLNWVNGKYLDQLLELSGERGEGQLPTLSLLTGNRRSRAPCVAIVPSQTHVAPPPPVAPSPAPVQPIPAAPAVMPREELPPVTTAPSVSNDPYEPEEPNVDLLAVAVPAGTAPAVHIKRNAQVEGVLKRTSYLNRTFVFENFVGGKPNQLIRAAAWQVMDNLKHGYNPLFLCSGVDLGKTHPTHAVGNHLLKENPDAKVIYLHSERSVVDMVKALQFNAINKFGRFYRSVDALLIGDIQLSARRERSQEESFHTFNALLEDGRQIILTSDRYPKEIEGLEERLKSCFGWGLAVAVESSELGARVAILMKKAEQTKIELPHDAAFFIAQHARSNVRELEGTLGRAIAHLHFVGQPITIEPIRESLRDLLALQDKPVSIDNVQRAVAEHYKIKISDLLSKRRSRSVARLHQMAMAFFKELTNHSLSKIGVAFGGRDHTAVLHACRKIAQSGESDADIRGGYKSLPRTLTT